MSEETRTFLEVDHRMVGWCEKAVVETFTSMFGAPVKLRDVQIELDPIRGNEITGVLPLIQASLEGALALSFPKTTIVSFAVASYKLLPNTLTEEMLIGAASEMTNIVFNLIRETYNANGFRFLPSFPIVIVGNAQAIYATFPLSKLALHFDTKHGPLMLEISAVQGIS